MVADTLAYVDREGRADYYSYLVPPILIVSSNTVTLDEEETRASINSELKTSL